MLSNTLRRDFCYLKIIHILDPPYHPKIKGCILKNKQDNKCVCIYEIIRLIMGKTKMKNTSYRHDKIGLDEHRSSKYRNCLSMMMLICIKQHLSNICSSIHEKVNQK